MKTLIHDTSHFAKIKIIIYDYYDYYYYYKKINI